MRQANSKVYRNAGREFVTQDTRHTDHAGEGTAGLSVAEAIPIGLERLVAAAGDIVRDCYLTMIAGG